MELRQKLLEASNRSVLAESQLRAEAEIKLRTVGLERESLERRLEEALTQVRELTGFRDTYATRMQEAIAQYKIDLNREHAEVLSNAEVEKARVQAERAVLEEKARAVERMMMQVKESHDEMDSLRNGLKQSKVELRAVLAERDDALHQIKELKLQVNTQSSTSALEFELQSLKMQLMQAEKTTEKWQTEHQNLLRDMMQPRNDHEKEIAKLRKSEAKWQRECQELVTKLDVEISRGEELERKYEDEMLTNKELKREISELRLALHRLQVKKDGASIADFDRAMPW
ncbi:hypothetical protein DFJ73DRAFT_23829 [Zopfochytrium polystomum]|nr:hypothetical protein DFJ73DRAFT_23829 [Zopfochytrium polystomum]